MEQQKGNSNSEEKNCCIKCEERFAILIDLQKELKEIQEQIMSAIEDSVLDEAVKRGISDHHSHNLVETVNNTLNHVSSEFEKRKSLENELDGLKDQISHNCDENLNLIEELKGNLAVRNEEIRVLKGQLDDLEKRLQSEKKKYTTDLDLLYQEIDQLEKVKESNESLKQQIVQLESSEFYENQLEKEVQTVDAESREELLKKIEELVEANEKLMEENQKLNKKVKSDSVHSLRHTSSASGDLNKKIEELIEINQKLQEENQKLSAPNKLSSEMYKSLECKHRETIRDLQKAHEKEKQDLMNDCGKEKSATQQFLAMPRKAFTTLDRFCSIVLSEGFKVRDFFVKKIILNYFVNRISVLWIYNIFMMLSTKLPFFFISKIFVKSELQVNLSLGQFKGFLFNFWFFVDSRMDSRQTKCSEKHNSSKKYVLTNFFFCCFLVYFIWKTFRLNNNENNLRIKLCDERKNQQIIVRRCS